MKTQTEKWIVSFPELKTRPELLEAMEQSRRIKHNVFASANFLLNVAKAMKANEKSARVVILCYQSVKKDLHELQDIMTPEVYGQLMGFIKNVYVNACIRSGLKGHIRKGKSKFFVDLEKVIQ